VLTAQAHSGEGIGELLAKIREHREFLTATSELATRRTQRRKQEFLETVEEELTRRLRALVEGDPDLIATLEKVARKEAEPYSSAMNFLDSYCASADWPGSLTPRPGYPPEEPPT
jgi:LAO/AO transport system kinase